MQPIMPLFLRQESEITRCFVPATQRYQKAADLGDAEAQNHLGAIYDMCV
jgi:hypothetical protein